MWNNKQISIRLKYFLINCMLIFTFFSCSTKTKYNDKIIFRYNESAGITNLDPAFGNRTENIWALCQLYNGLVEMDAELNVSPAIAKRWSISEDGKTYLFSLRNDVLFHQNECFGKVKTRACNANDFVYSFNRIINAENASPGKWIFSNVESFSAINDTLLKINLKNSYAPFLSILTMPYAMVVPQEAVVYHKDKFRSNPVGTGPFYLKKWLEGEKMILRKNPLYFEKDSNQKQLPYIDAVNISFVKDKQSAYLQFLRNKFDYLSGIDGSYKDDLLNSEGELNTEYDGKFLLKKFTYLKTDYLGFNLNSKNRLVKNKKFRQAISCSIDRLKLIKYLRNNIGKASSGNFIPFSLLKKKLESQHFQYNPNLAKQLLNDVLKEEKVSLQLKLSTSSAFADIAEFIQQQLAETGVKLTIEIVPSAINSEQISKGDVEFFRKTWIADYPDVENFLTLFYSENIPPFGANYSRFNNSAFDAYFNKLYSENENAKRLEYAYKCDSIIAEECPVIALFHDEAVVACNKKFKNIGFNAMNILSIKRANIK